jgi:hypothetical protein
LRHQGRYSWLFQAPFPKMRNVQLLYLADIPSTAEERYTRWPFSKTAVLICEVWKRKWALSLCMHVLNMWTCICMYTDTYRSNPKPKPNHKPLCLFMSWNQSVSISVHHVYITGTHILDILYIEEGARKGVLIGVMYLGLLVRQVRWLHIMTQPVSTRFIYSNVPKWWMLRIELAVVFHTHTKSALYVFPLLYVLVSFL